MPNDPDEHKQMQTPKHKKVFDITRPGSMPAAANSRSVTMHSDVHNDISDISAPPDRKPTLAADPSDTQNTLMSAKSRVVVQPAGTLNKDRDGLQHPTESVPEAPIPPAGIDTAVSSSADPTEPGQEAPLDAFDYSALSKDGFQDTVSHQQYGQPDSAQSASVPRQDPDANPTDPNAAPRVPAGPTPDWVKAAEKDIIAAGPDTDITDKPATLILEDPKKGFNWVKFGIIVTIIIFAIMAVLIVVANTVSFGP